MYKKSFSLLLMIIPLTTFAQERTSPEDLKNAMDKIQSFQSSVEKNYMAYEKDGNLGKRTQNIVDAIHHFKVAQDKSYKTPIAYGSIGLGAGSAFLFLKYLQVNRKSVYAQQMLEKLLMDIERTDIHVNLMSMLSQPTPVTYFDDFFQRSQEKDFKMLYSDKEIWNILRNIKPIQKAMNELTVLHPATEGVNPIDKFNAELGEGKIKYLFASIDQWLRGKTSEVDIKQAIEASDDYGAEALKYIETDLKNMFYDRMAVSRLYRQSRGWLSVSIWVAMTALTAYIVSIDDDRPPTKTYVRDMDLVRLRRYLYFHPKEVDLVLGKDNNP